MPICGNNGAQMQKATLQVCSNLYYFGTFEHLKNLVNYITLKAPPDHKPHIIQEMGTLHGETLLKYNTLWKLHTEQPYKIHPFWDP